jgi:cytochrome c1
MKKFQFNLSMEIYVWTNTAEFKYFDTDTYRARTHPVFLTPFKYMDPVQKVKDDKCRALAVSFLKYIERSRYVM